MYRFIVKTSVKYTPFVNQITGDNRPFLSGVVAHSFPERVNRSWSTQDLLALSGKLDSACHIPVHPPTYGILFQHLARSLAGLSHAEARSPNQTHDPPTRNPKSKIQNQKSPRRPPVGLLRTGPPAPQPGLALGLFGRCRGGCRGPGSLIGSVRSGPGRPGPLCGHRRAHAHGLAVGRADRPPGAQEKPGRAYLFFWFICMDESPLPAWGQPGLVSVCGGFRVGRRDGTHLGGPGPSRVAGRRRGNRPRCHHGGVGRRTPS